MKEYKEPKMSNIAVLRVIGSLRNKQMETKERMQENVM
jgi:hypothetical protein